MPGCALPDPPWQTQPPADDPHLGEVSSSAAVREFSEFYKAEAPRLVGFLRCYGAAWDDAADFAQEALLECFQQWSTITHPYAWCRTVATRHLYNRRVAIAREHRAAKLDSVGSVLLPPNSDIDKLEHRHVLLALLDQLPPKQREVLALIYDNATRDEIAEILGISSDSVRSNLRYARIKLRELWDQFGVDR